RRTRNPDPRKTKPHAHKNVGFVSSLKPAQHAGFFFALRALSGNVGRLVGDPRMRRHLTKLLTT
ncbi:hypothetical protein, partial [Burkholderia pseudomallei]|uniref:hypothetical protein n=1 Tax=Burkholderia pseudomallei TaxID=28450 RepID=UPI001C4C9901